MNGNLAYWQLDFTVESQANLAPDCMVMQENPRAFGGVGGPQTPGLFYPSAYGLPLFSDIFFKEWYHPCLLEHDVDVGDSAPIVQHPYTVCPIKKSYL